VTQPLEPEDEEIIDATIVEAADADTIEYQSAAPFAPADGEGDRDNTSPWFGYIGLGIALVAMLIGLAGVVAAIFLFIGWTQG
jgi:hypothetical protein